MRKITRWLVNGDWRTAKELAGIWGISDVNARYRAWRERHMVRRV